MNTKLEFATEIKAPKQKVWDIMLAPDTYKEWVSVSWPNSEYEGKWEKGENLLFGSPGQGGTLATLVEHRPYEYTLAEHIAIINPDGSEDRDSEMAKGWIGCTEAYTFTEKDGVTQLNVEINTPAAWADMFKEGWPNALAKLKEICEK
jgi:uncharacterized protein YndB with AHSA1/START domain